MNRLRIAGDGDPCQPWTSLCRSRLPFPFAKDEKGNDELKVRVTAAPEKGQANKAVIDILSKSFKVGKSKVVLQHGETSRHKKFLLTGITRKGIEELL